ncbi:hypothetical protein J4417_03465 [Candidatus Woesearchaeota archaeon]|nr:hypothetical protein [Candidatus Woesearchaeota archaeon]
MKSIISLILLSVLLAVLVLTTFVWFFPPNKEEVLVKEFDFYVTEGQSLGFNLDKDLMHFGSIPAGSGAYRKIIINNTHLYAENVEFKIVSDKSLGSWFSIQPDITDTLKPKEVKEYLIYLTIPPNASVGRYTGKILTIILPVK